MAIILSEEEILSNKQQQSLHIGFDLWCGGKLTFFSCSAKKKTLNFMQLQVLKKNSPSNE